MTVQLPRVVRILSSALILVSAACGGPPTRLVAGKSDTVLVNSRRPVVLPIRALDAKGNERRANGVRYELVSGDSVRISPTGVVTCPRRGDTHVRASLGGLTTEFVLLCRPVKGFRFVLEDPFVAGGPPRELALGAIGIDDMPVTLLAGTATISDSEVASLRGLTIVPRRAGLTSVTVDIGDCVHSIFVEVDEPVKASLDLQRRNQVFILPSLRLVGGEIRSWPIPRGEYMLNLRPTAAGQKQLVLGGVSMNCVSHPDVGQAYHCLGFNNAAVVVRNMQAAGQGHALEGALSIKRMDPPPQSAPPRARAVQQVRRREKASCRGLR